MTATARKGDYPQEWRDGTIQRAIYERAGWRCEHCGMEFVEGTTLAVDARRADGSPVVLTVHHLDGNPANCAYENLVALCQRCHLHVQALWKPGDVLPAHWPQPPEWIAKRGLAWRRNGQMRLPLFGEKGDFRGRYVYLGDRLTDPALRGMVCDPVRDARGKCIVSVRMASALVVDAQGRRYVVARRRLRLREKLERRAEHGREG